MANPKEKVFVRLPRGVKYNGTLCGYQFVNGIAEGVLSGDAKRFHWEVFDPKAEKKELKELEPKKPDPETITLDNLDEADYGELRSFYFAHKDEEGFPKPASQSKENLHEAIGAYLVSETRQEEIND